MVNDNFIRRAAALLAVAVITTGCATAPYLGNVTATVAAEGFMDADNSGRTYTWIQDEAQQTDPIVQAIISVASSHLERHGMVLVSDSARADFLIATNTELDPAGESTSYYSVQTYVPGPSHSYDREVRVYDINGRYVGTRRERVTERQPGQYVNQQRSLTYDVYDRTIEFSFIVGDDFNEGEVEPVYFLGARSNGSSDTIGLVGGCMIQMMFEVFPKTLSQARVSGIQETAVDQCNLPGYSTQ